jgi:glyoxylase-like metal-dependent hydrolase (beta-lactamase superfamily II)
MEIMPIYLSMSTCYLLPCEGGFLQVDTGYARDYDLYRKRLRKMGIPIEKIRYVFLTHHHDDHAGFLNELTRDTDAILIAHEKAVDLLQSGANDKSQGGGYVSRRVKVLADLKMRLDKEWTLTFPPFKVRSTDILVTGDDDQLLRTLGIPGTILETPGHCVDHISPVLDSGAAFCGDAAADMLRWAGTKYCTVFMTDMERAYQSWDWLLEAGAQQIFPAHGKPFSSEKLRQNRGRIRNQDLVKFF